MVSTAFPLLTNAERADARRLIERQGLAFEDGCDELVGIYDGDRLVATAGRAGYVLKMFAIEEGGQGGDALGQLTTALVGLARRAGHDSVLVYTRPQHAASFEACGFELLVACGAVTLLEHGGGLAAYLAEQQARVDALADGSLPRRSAEGSIQAGLPRRSAEGGIQAGLPRRSAEGGIQAGLPRRSAEGAKAGGVVINGNPFTRGHLYLVEQAAAQVDRLYLFVVREDRSIFPFDVRYRMAQEGTRHLPNVVLLHTSRYAVSAGTFPSYFLKETASAKQKLRATPEGEEAEGVAKGKLRAAPEGEQVEGVAKGKLRATPEGEQAEGVAKRKLRATPGGDEAARLQMEVDARLFGARIAPAFSIGCRFVGHEPYCSTTAGYNDVLAEVLPQYGVALRVVERTGDESGFVSATRVRAALAAGDMDTVARLVPETTMALLAQGRAGL